MRKKSSEYQHQGTLTSTSDIPAGLLLRSLHETVKQSSIFSWTVTEDMQISRVARLCALQLGPSLVPIPDPHRVGAGKPAVFGKLILPSIVSMWRVRECSMS